MNEASAHASVQDEVRDVRKSEIDAFEGDMLRLADGRLADGRLAVGRLADGRLAGRCGMD